MNEEHFNHIEQKIIQAAENIRPEYSESAWDRMELLLDKEKKKKRPFFWWLPYLGVLFTATLILYLAMVLLSSKHKNIHDKQPAAPTKTVAQKQNVPAQMPDKTAKGQTTFMNEPASMESTREKTSATVIAHARNHAAAPPKPSSNQIETFQKADSTMVTFRSARHTSRSKNEIPIHPIQPKLSWADSIPENRSVSKIKSSTTDKSLFRHLYVTGNIGAESSGLSLFSGVGSNFAAKYGLGIGYQINDRLSVETGFYLGSKKYLAGPEHYTYPEDSYWNTVDLVQIDADCFIYEIPVLLHYSVVQKGSFRLTVGGGLQSFIMKKEDYIYDYIKNGTPYTSSKSYEGNRHLLSSVQFSLGLEKKINQNTSFFIQPSASIPLRGVGNGKIKLYHTTVQTGVKLFPFQKK